MLTCDPCRALISTRRNYQRFQALRQLRVQREVAGSDAGAAPSSAPSAGRLAELVASLKSHAEETWRHVSPWKNMEMLEELGVLLGIAGNFGGNGMTFFSVFPFMEMWEPKV